MQSVWRSRLSARLTLAAYFLKHLLETRHLPLKQFRPLTIQLLHLKRFGLRINQEALRQQVLGLVDDGVE